MAARGTIHIDLRRELLALPAKVHIYPDELSAWTAEAFARTTPRQGPRPPVVNLLANDELELGDDRLTFMHRGQDVVFLYNQRKEPVEIPVEVFDTLLDCGELRVPDDFAERRRQAPGDEIWWKASPEDRAEALRRLRILDGQETEGLPSQRQRARWRVLRDASRKLYGRLAVLLLPEPRSGPDRQIPDDDVDAVMEGIRKYYLATPSRSIRAAHGLYCTDRGDLPCVTYESFRYRASSLKKAVRDAARLGSKAAYASEPEYWKLDYATPRHGQFPFEYVHLDHTLLDIVLRDSETGEIMGRPWLTLLVDAYSRRVLAFYLSFMPPSRISCFMVFRELVARYGQLPQTVIVDGGAEFDSIDYELFLLDYGCHKETRPGGKTRFGNDIETIFGTTTVRLIWNLMGNTKATKNVRLMTPEVDPDKLALWTLPRLTDLLRRFLYENYDNERHPSLATSPLKKYQQGRKRSGESGHVPINYSKAFLLNTMPSTSKGIAKYTPGKGFRIHGLAYTNDEADGRLEGKSWPIRWDPIDVSHVYGWDGKEWVECSAKALIPHAMSVAELKLFSTEHRTRIYLNGKVRRASGDMAALMASAYNEEGDLSRARQIARRAAREQQKAYAETESGRRDILRVVGSATAATTGVAKYDVSRMEPYGRAG